MDLTLWDSSFGQVTQEWNNQIIDGLEHGFYFELGLDVIEERAIDEKCCIQVLRKLITEADNEIVQLEEDLVFLQSQLACADEDWSQLCSTILREKIEYLDISILCLKSEKFQSKDDTREPAESLHNILKDLLRNFSPKKDNQCRDVIFQESSSDHQGEETQFLAEKTQKRNSASSSVRNLQAKDVILTFGDKHVISNKNLKSLGNQIKFPISIKLENTIRKGSPLASARLADSLIDGGRTSNKLNMRRTKNMELPEHLTQNSLVKPQNQHKFHTEPLEYEPLAIILPPHNSEHEKPLVQKSSDILPRNSNSKNSIRRSTNKSFNTSGLSLEDKQKPSTGCNRKKKLSNIVSGVTNEKEIGSEGCTEKSIILVSALDLKGSRRNTSVKPTSNSISSPSKEACDDTSNLKAEESTVSSTSHIAAESPLCLLFNRQGNTTPPKRNRIRKARERDPNWVPASRKRRINSDTSGLKNAKALVTLEDVEASNSENAKPLPCSTLLNDLKVVELRAIAKQRGMTGMCKLRKSELVERIGFELNKRGMMRGKRDTELLMIQDQAKRKHMGITVITYS